MGAPIPCLGYRSRTAAALALRAEGLTMKQIAARIGISEKDTHALILSSHRRADCRVTLTADQIERLKPHADKRDVTGKELARQIIETVIAENMIDAVLDDLET